jgi:hypothetical protein
MTIPEIASQLRIVLGVCVNADTEVSPAQRIYFAAAQNDSSDEEIISFWLSVSTPCQTIQSKGGVLLEDWCDLMRAELKIFSKELAELRRDSGNGKHWLYVRSCLEECSSSLDIISGVIPKNTVLLTFAPSNE